MSLILAICASVTVAAFWFSSTWLLPVPQRTLRIGFESNPPVQTRTEHGYSGLAVETVDEAAKRAGIKLQWVETGTSSEEAFEKGLVDLWPLMVDYPYRRKLVHFARPWMHSSDILLVRDDVPNPDRHFKGSIAVFKIPLHVRLAREQFPEAHIVEVPNLEDVIRQACKGADAGFMEARVAMLLLREKFQECSPMTFRVQAIPGLKFGAGLASTFEAAGAADRMQGEIDNMFRDGVLAGLIAKYSYFGLDDTWASYEQMEAEKKWRWVALGIGGVVFALGLTLWQASSLRQRKRAEVVLRESEERLRFAQQAAGIGTFDWNIETDVSRWTPELEAIYGLARGGFAGTHSAWEDLIHPDDRALSLQRQKEAFDSGMPVEGEWRTILPDGGVRWVFGRWQVFKNAAGKPIRMMGVNMDVTDRKNVEETLRQSEERFRLAVLATNDAIWDIDLVTGTVSWNETYTTLFGRPAEASKSWQWWIDRIHPEDRERTSVGLSAAISGSESSWTCEYRFQQVDGGWAHLYDRAYIARDPSGSAWRVIGAMQNLTERKRAEEALRESEERFRRVFEEGPLGLALVGKDYRFLKVNGALCQMVGYSEASLLQMTFADITHPDDLRADEELAERLFRREIPFFRLRKRYVKKNGEIIWIGLTRSVIRDKKGEVMYALAMIEDITEVKRAQEIEIQLASDLEHSRDEVRALAASLMKAQENERRRISRELHDQICHQLGSLAADIGDLAVSPLAPENLRAHLTAIRARAFKTSQETHDIAYQMHTAILDDLGLLASLKALCRQFSEQYPSIAVDFKNSGPPTSIPSEVATCLYRVAQESLQNVAKHSGAKNVSVRLGFEKGAVVFTIQDDGAGFDPKAVKGHGAIGLISMRERAHFVKGKLTITAQPGHGTQVSLKAPLPLGNS